MSYEQFAHALNFGKYTEKAVDRMFLLQATLF